MKHTLGHIQASTAIHYDKEVRLSGAGGGGWQQIDEDVLGAPIEHEERFPANRAHGKNKSTAAAVRARQQTDRDAGEPQRE